jgi:hypothetical protein
MFIGYVYTLTAADGTVCVFNSSSDPNFVGFLTDVGGLDSAEVRSGGEDNVEADGGRNWNSYFGRRPITFEGILPQSSEAVRQGRIEKLQRALNSAMRTDAVLSWIPADGITRYVLVRRNLPLRITGGVDKRFIFGLIAESHLIESTPAIVTSDAVAPLSVNATNSGNAAALPTVEITGATTSPVTVTIAGVTVARLNYAIPVGRKVTINFKAKTAVDDLGANHYDKIDFAVTTWAGIPPGATSAVASDKGTVLTVTHRHSWA